MTKRTLRLFCDYMAETPVWESFDCKMQDWPDGEYNKTKETLKKYGVSAATLVLCDALQVLFEKEKLSYWEEECFYKLREVILERLWVEIGDKFIINYWEQ